MWRDLEQGIDGMIGRMMSWLTHAPVSAFEISDERPIEEAVDEVVETASAEADVEIVEAAGVEATIEAAVVATEVAEVEERVLGGLAESGASRKELERRLGLRPGPLRQHLNRLIEAGKVQRKGKGMRTRYHRIDD